MKQESMIHKIKKNNRQKIIIEVAGGLGNQLFGYFAAVYFAGIFKSKVKIDLLYASKAHSKTFNISSFDLDVEYLNYRNNKISQLWKLLWRLSDSLNYRSATFRRIREKYFHTYTEKPLSQFDPNLVLKLHKQQRLKGFFTTCLYLERLQENGLFKTLNLANPSSWYQMMEKIAEQERPIAVHIRRGDFLQSKDTHGVLSESYYRKALKQARSKYPNSPIWVFTNAIDEVKVWDFFQNSQTVFIENIYSAGDHSNDDPAEHLKLMSCAIVNIVANSSFSLFAAMLNPNVQLVLCPNSSAKSEQYRVSNFFPDNWVKLDAEWE